MLNLARLAKLLKRPSRHPVSQSAQVSNVTSGLAGKPLTLELSQRLLSQVQDAGKPTFDSGVLGNPCVVHQGSVLQTLLDHLPHFLRRHWGDDVFHQDLHSTQARMSARPATSRGDCLDFAHSRVLTAVLTKILYSKKARVFLRPRKTVRTDLDRLGFAHS